MSIRRLTAGLLVLLATTASGTAQPSSRVAAGSYFPIMDLGLLPNLSPREAAGYQSFLLTNEPRAFAVSATGRSGWFGGAGTIEQARQKALGFCNRDGMADCEIYAENLDVVWPTAQAALHTPAPGPLITGPGYAFVPDQRFLWHGPLVARGLYVWGHGRAPNVDSRGLQPPAYVRFFNNAGFDIVRFDRDPATDLADRAAGWLHEGLARLRTFGWDMVVVGGQSRGAWNSLQILDTPGLADVVIAISPAANGTNSVVVNSLGQFQFRTIADRARAPTTRLAITQFTDDPFAGDEDQRRSTIEQDFRPHVGPLLLIDRPPGFSGHGAGNSRLFAEQFGACLLQFATAANPPTSCPAAAR
jgi:hypothetical protein